MVSERIIDVLKARSVCFLLSSYLAFIAVKFLGPTAIAETTASSLSEKFLRASASNVVVVAHRGCWSHAPENSILSIRRCMELGVDVVEIDVRRTRDGQLVVLHDETVDRTSDGHGNVADMSLKQLKNLRLKNRNGGDHDITAQMIPTLEEALLSAKDNILVNLDIKANDFAKAMQIVRDTDVVDQVIMKRRALVFDPPVQSSFQPSQVISMPVVFQEDSPDYAVIHQQLSHRPDAIELIFSDLDFGFRAAQLAKSGGIPAWVNTLGVWSAGGLEDTVAVSDPSAVWGRLIDMGFSIIQTDEPELLLNYLSTRRIMH